MKTPSCHVEIQLANTNGKTSYTLVSKTQDPGPISDHDSIDFIMLPVVDHACHL